MEKLREVFSLSLIKQALISWWRHDPLTQSAAVAYFAIFAFPALIILYFAGASFFLQAEDLQQQVFQFIEKSFGQQAVATFETVIENTAPRERDFWPFALAGGILVYAALRLFMQLQKALNHIWEVDASKTSSLRKLIGKRLATFAVMIGILFVLAASLIFTSAISTLTAWLTRNLPAVSIYLVHGFNFLFSLLIISILFSLILKKLPDIELRWQNVYPGALIAALLFMLGEYLLGIFFATARPASAYGVTGSVVLLMIWVTYSCSILLLGAEYNKALHQHLQQRKTSI